MAGSKFPMRSFFWTKWVLSDQGEISSMSYTPPNKQQKSMIIIIVPPMSEKRESRKRNHKSEPLERGFGCPCGKTYLSYPALFTHIKQKHGGTPPGPIIKPKSQNTKRGRPRTSSVSITEAEQPFQKDDNPLLHLEEILSASNVECSLALSNCVSILNLFLAQSALYLSQATRPRLSAYLQLLHQSIDKFNGPNYSLEHDASEIIESSNLIVRECHLRRTKDLPLPLDSFVKLTKLFFEWLYRSNLTDHIIEEQRNVELQL